MRFILLAFLFLSLSAHSQPASFGFLTYKNSTLTLFTPASPNEIKTITAQTLGGQQACCITSFFPTTKWSLMSNWAFNADANTGNVFGIFIACVGTLRASRCGAG